MNDDYECEYIYHITIKNELCKAGINLALKPFSIPALIVLMTGQDVELETDGMVM